ncbi:MreB/Mrl family cell shape determining protein [candidate division KSB3 bacterium]|uniref:Cell shape-determining protein MreB n=1 Tax=candidate division KSB3 bacterium TaxID=2044937 RepID=A0A9D5JRL9_9BACT|nr:MreB/Mrl family cell shape determining protein [candidate division KSB3 bacterium]MBD3322985.1 MreB/Mrl family cell shape determining protein [candidate division KSB3 bacterium]
MRFPLVHWFADEMAIDLGTANTVAYAQGRGIVFNEPSIVAIHADTQKVVALGLQAKQMIGKTPENILALQPMKDGVIADFRITEALLRYVIRKSLNKGKFFRPKTIICIPSGITEVEKKAVKDSALASGASQVYLVEETLAAAMGVGLPIEEPSGNMIVDIGGGTTEVTVISLFGVVYSKSIRLGGNKIDEAIIQYIKRTYNLLIGERTAELIKMTIGSAYPLDEEQQLNIKGRDLVEGIPKTLSIHSEEIRDALAEITSTIVETVKIALERTPPELASDIADRGIILTGGGALLKNLDLRLREETKLPITLSEDPLMSVVLGAGKMIGNPDLLRQVMID